MLGGGKPTGSVLVFPAPPAPPRATKGRFLLPLIPRINLLTPALYMGGSGSSCGYRRIAVTVVHAVYVCDWSLSCLLVERSGANNISRRSKTFVTTATLKSWAKIWPRGHVSGHFKMLEEFFANIFTHKK